MSASIGDPGGKPGAGVDGGGEGGKPGAGVDGGGEGGRAAPVGVCKSNATSGWHFAGSMPPLRKHLNGVVVEAVEAVTSTPSQDGFRTHAALQPSKLVTPSALEPLGSISTDAPLPSHQQLSPGWRSQAIATACRGEGEGEGDGEGEGEGEGEGGAECGAEGDGEGEGEDDGNDCGGNANGPGDDTIAGLGLGEGNSGVSTCNGSCASAFELAVGKVVSGTVAARASAEKIVPVSMGRVAKNPTPKRTPATK